MDEDGNHRYSHVFSNGFDCDMSLSGAGMNCRWSPAPQSKEWNSWLRTKSAQKRFLEEYWIWRDECLADFTDKTGFKILVID